MRPNLIAGVVALALLGLAVGMGWGSGKGKAEVLDKAAGDVVHFDNGYNPFAGRHTRRGGHPRRGRAADDRTHQRLDCHQIGC